MQAKLATTWPTIHAVAIASLGGVAPLSAHHSVSTIDLSTSVWVKGTVVRYEPISPHTRFEIEERNTDGQVQRWTIEGPFPGRLQRILNANGMQAEEHFLRAGDAIEVCGFRPKRSASTSANTAGAASVPPPYLHGYVLVMPDGRMQSWGPYGRLDNCVRPNDEPELWSGFLDADSLARGLWCQGKPFLGRVASTAPPGFIAEIDRLLTHPC